MVTYSDYGGNIQYDEQKNLYKYTVYIGGFGSCGNDAILFGKSKIEYFKIKNGFSTYKVVEGHYYRGPGTKCVLYINFIK